MRSISLARPLATFAFALSALAAPTFAMADAQLDKALAGAHRSDANKARDKYRNPKQTLAFFGVKPESAVVEISPGGGWYTEVLAPYLRDKGRYYAASTERGLKGLKERMAKHPEVFDKAGTLAFTLEKVDFRPEGGADVVLTFRNVHNWLKDDFQDKMFKAAFDALKPGGVFGVVEHRAKPGTTIPQSIDSGYMDEAWVIARVQAAGFKLEGKSEINANAKDTKDYAKGVWTLPP
ncbi:MAG: class I SAM-dependent methyltransferase, partial [Betaproteobacteria bacterium]|nr:class I SAM-dependent methyltransferase [Betaproteobacteria bacterium]